MATRTSSRDAVTTAPADPIDTLLSAHGLRRTAAARLVLGWLLAHPDLVDLPAVRAVIDFVTACAREDRVRLRG